MPRQRRSSPARASPVRPAVSRPAPQPVQQRQPVPVSQPPTALAQPQPAGQGILSSIATTAAGVAIGKWSCLLLSSSMFLIRSLTFPSGHTVGHAITGAMSSGEAAPQAAAAPEQVAQPAQQSMNQEPCYRELKDFLRCSEEQVDLALCSGYNQLLRECRQSRYMNWYRYSTLMPNCANP